MALPLLSKFFPEIVGKPVSDFTLEDWQTVAYKSASIADELMAELCPPQKKRGRPKKCEPSDSAISLVDLGVLGAMGSENVLAALLGRSPTKRKRGRPVTRYYGLSVATIEEITEDVVKAVARPDVRRKWPKAPRTKRHILENLLSILQSESGGYHDPRAIERALRRFRADKKQK